MRRPMAHRIRHSLCFHLFNMGARVISAAIVVDAAIIFRFVVSAKTAVVNSDSGPTLIRSQSARNRINIAG